MFNGIHVQENEFEFVKEIENEKIASDTIKLKSTKKYKVYDYIINLENGKYGKTQICEELDIPAKRLSNYISKRNILFKPLIENKKISINRYDITVNS